MESEAIHAILGDLPYMTLAQGQRMQQLIKRNHLRDCLELGFYHGVSSAYIAGALDVVDGTLTTIDREDARALRPNIMETLSRLGLGGRVRVHFERSSYTWHLMAMLEEERAPRFDLCYFDGGHTWDATGFAFFLVDRLLRPGGWVIFDDLDFTYDGLRGTPDWSWIERLPAEERSTRQVRKVYDLLVTRHDDYEGFVEMGNWGIARKRR